METNKKVHNPSKKRVKYILILLIMFMVWASIIIYQQWLNIDKIKNKVTELEKNEQTVIKTRENLEKKVLLLQDYNYIAELARKYYFLSKPGEIIFISPKE